MKLFQSGLITLLCVLTLSCQKEKKVVTVESSPSVGGSSSVPIRWSTTKSIATTPLNLVITTDYAGSDLTSLQNSIAEWNNATTQFTFFNILSGPNREFSNLDDYNDDEMGIYKINTWFSGVSTSALAITQYFAIRRNSGTASEYLELTHADILFNDDRFDFGHANDGGTTAEYDMASVAVHELGHFLGLQHTATTISSVMKPSLNSLEVRRTLTSYDLTSISQLYAPEVAALEADEESYMQGIRRDEDGYDINDEDEAGEPVRGIIEIHSDGSCHHYENGKLMLKHQR
jgi:hypothetical protein